MSQTFQPERDAHPLSSFTTITLARDGGAELHTTNGRRITAQVGAPDETSAAVSTTFEVATSTLHLELDDGTTFALDIGYQGRDDPAPVLYLDQNHWIDLARARIGSDKITGAKKVACLRLIELALDQRVILPLSAAHLVETAKVGSTRRTDLARTMVELSRCWQMRSPLQVRALELAALLTAGADPGGEEGDEVDAEPGSLVPAAAVPGVFTLEPRAMWNDAHARGGDPAEGVDRYPDMPTEVADELGGLTDRISWAVGLTETLLEEVGTHSQVGDERAEKWAQHHYELAQILRTEGASKERAREATLLAFINDMRDDVARAFMAAGRDVQEFTPWVLERADDAFLPSRTKLTVSRSKKPQTTLLGPPTTRLG